MVVSVVKLIFRVAVFSLSFLHSRKHRAKLDTARVLIFGRVAPPRSFTTHPLFWVTLSNAFKTGTLCSFQNSGAYTAFRFYEERP